MLSYEQAKLSETAREGLQREIKAYQEQYAACREVYGHLQEGLKGRRTLVDLAEAKEKLSMLRRQKELVLRRQRKMGTAACGDDQNRTSYERAAAFYGGRPQRVRLCEGA